jgi:hypothetical protein
VKAKSSKIEDCHAVKDLEICPQKQLKLYFGSAAQQKIFGICFAKVTPVNCILINRAAKPFGVLAKRRAAKPF